MDSNWRGGLPNPCGQDRGTDRVAAAEPPAAPAAPEAAAPGRTFEPAVPLAARLSAEMIDWLSLSGGASGDSSALELGCWAGGRRTVGRRAVATMTTSPKYASGSHRSISGRPRRRRRPGRSATGHPSLSQQRPEEVLRYVIIVGPGEGCQGTLPLSRVHDPRFPGAMYSRRDRARRGE